MSEIKVGEYLRLYNGMIVKWGEKQDTRIIGSAYLDCSGEYEWSCSIVKHSFNITDLIEYGDVLEIFVNDNDIQKIVVYGDELYSLKIGELIAEDIKSIVTHEQFQSVEYRLGE